MAHVYKAIHYTQYDREVEEINGCHNLCSKVYIFPNFDRTQTGHEAVIFCFLYWPQGKKIYLLTLDYLVL